MSSAIRPRTSTPKRSEGLFELEPAAADEREGTRDFERRLRVDELAGLPDGAAAARDQAGHDQGLGLLPARGEAAAGQELVRALFHRRLRNGAS